MTPQRPAPQDARPDEPQGFRRLVRMAGRPYLVAALWVRAEAAADRDAIAARVETVNRELARHETIKRFFISQDPLTVEGGTLTSSLKLRRKAVYEALRDRFEALYS